MTNLSEVPEDQLIGEIKRRGLSVTKCFSVHEIASAADDLGLLDDDDEPTPDDYEIEALGESAVVRLRGGDVRGCLFLIGGFLADRSGFYDFHNFDDVVARRLSQGAA